MDPEEDRFRKIAAAKRRLEEYQQKPSAISSEDIVKSESYLKTTQRRDIMASSETLLPATSDELKDLAPLQSDKIIELEEILIGKQSVIDSLIEENEVLKARLENTSISNIDLSFQDKEVLSTVEEYNLKLTSLEDAVKDRDESIRRLMENVQSLTRNRDELQLEYTTQIDQLTENVHTLQSQLKQAGQWLHKQLGETSALALVEAKEEILALQKDSAQKESQLKALQDAIKQRDAAMQTLIIQINENNISYTSIQKEIQMLKIQLDEKNEELSKYESAKAEKGSKFPMELSSDLFKNFSDSLKILSFEGNSTYDDIIRLMDKSLSALRAELDEFYGIEISKIKDCLTTQHQNEIRRLRADISQLEAERTRYSCQASRWQEQYVLLSQQNISASDLVQEVGNVLTENIRLNQLVDELRAQVHVSSSKMSLPNTENGAQISHFVDTESLVMFEKGLHELEKLKAENREMEKVFCDKNQLIQELEDQVSSLKEEQRSLYEKEKVELRASLQSEFELALRKNEENIVKLSEEKSQLLKEISSWQQQYLLLSQQNVSSTDLVEQISSVITENIRLNQLIDELNSKSILRFKDEFVNCDIPKKPLNNECVVDVYLQKEIEELKRVKLENAESEKMFFTREQFEVELESKLDVLKNEFMEMSKHEFNQALTDATTEYNSQVYKLNEELKNIASQKLRLENELSSWRGQYIKLSQQSLSNSDLLEEITILKNENAKLMRLQEETKTSKMMLTKSSQCESDEQQTTLRSLLFTKEQLNEEIEKHLAEQKSIFEKLHYNNVQLIREEMTLDFKRDIERLNRELVNISEQRDKYSDDVKTWQTQYLALSDKVSFNGSFEEQLDFLKSENHSLKVTIASLNAQLDSLMKNLEQNSLNHVSEMDAAGKEIAKLMSAVQSSNSENTSSLMHHSALYKELETLRLKYIDLEKQNNNLRLDKDGLESDINNLQSRFKNLDAESMLLTSKYIEEINTLTSSIESLQLEHKTDIEKMENEFNQRISDLQLLHRVECDQLNSRHQSEVENLNILMTHLNSSSMSLGIEKEGVEKHLAEAIETLTTKICTLEGHLKEKSEQLDHSCHIQEQDKMRMETYLNEAKQMYEAKLVQMIDEHKNFEHDKYLEIDLLQSKLAKLEDDLEKTKQLYEVKISSLVEEHHNSICEKLLEFNHIQANVVDLNECLEKVTKERDSTMESLQNIYCEKVELKLELDKLTSEKEKLQKKVNKLSDKNKFLAMAKSVLNKSINVKPASSVDVTLNDHEKNQSVSEQEYKELMEEKQILQSELIDIEPEIIKINMGSKVIMKEDKCVSQKMEETQCILDGSLVLLNELKAKYAEDMLQAKKKQIALIEKLQLFMESQMKVTQINEKETPHKFESNEHGFPDFLSNAEKKTRGNFIFLMKDFSVQCSLENSCFVSDWFTKVAVVLENECALTSETSDLHPILTKLSHKILSLKDDQECYASYSPLNIKEASHRTDEFNLSPHKDLLLLDKEGQSISQRILEHEYVLDDFQDICLDDCSSTVDLVLDQNSMQDVNILAKNKKRSLDEEHSPTKVVSYTRLLEIQQLRKEISLLNDMLQSVEHEKEIMINEFDKRILSLMEHNENTKSCLKDEIERLNKEVFDLVEKLRQSNLAMEKVVAEKDSEISGKVSEIERIEKYHKQTFNEAIARHEEKESGLGHALSTSKMQITELESRIEAISKEKIALEQEFVNELEQLTKEHDSRIKSFKESVSKESHLISLQLGELQEKVVNLSDELEIAQLENLRLSKVINDIKSDEYKLNSTVASNSGSHVSVGETWQMRLSSLDEAKLDLEKSLESSKADLEKLSNENVQLCVELENLKQKKVNESISVEVETDVSYDLNTDTINRITCLREEKALLASMVERLTNEKDQLLIVMMSKNQSLELDLSNMELENDEIESEERSGDPRIKLLEAEKELLANMLEKVSTENEKLLSYLKQKEHVDVETDDVEENEFKHINSLENLKNDNVLLHPDRVSPAFSDQIEAFHALETGKRSLELTVESLNLLLSEKQQTIDFLTHQLDSIRVECSNSQDTPDLPRKCIPDVLSMNLEALELSKKLNRNEKCVQTDDLQDLMSLNLENLLLNSKSLEQKLVNLKSLRQYLVSELQRIANGNLPNYDFDSIDICDLINMFFKSTQEANEEIKSFDTIAFDESKSFTQLERLVEIKKVVKQKQEISLITEKSIRQEKTIFESEADKLSNLELQKLAEFNITMEDKTDMNTYVESVLSKDVKSDQQAKLHTMKKAKLLKSKKLQEKNDEREYFLKKVAELTESNKLLENSNQAFIRELEYLRSQLSGKTLLDHSFLKMSSVDTQRDECQWIIDTMQRKMNELGVKNLQDKHFRLTFDLQSSGGINRNKSEALIGTYNNSILEIADENERQELERFLNRCKRCERDHEEDEAMHNEVTNNDMRDGSFKKYYIDSGGLLSLKSPQGCGDNMVQECLDLDANAGSSKYFSEHRLFDNETEHDSHLKKFESSENKYDELNKEHFTGKDIRNTKDIDLLNMERNISDCNEKIIMLNKDNSLNTEEDIKLINEIDKLKIENKQTRNKGSQKAAKLGQENDHAKEVMAQKAEIENLSTELSMKENECSRFQLSFQELQKDLDDKCDCIKMLENENASLKSQMNDFTSIQQELSAMKDALHNEKAAKLGQENDHAKEVMAQKAEIENLSTELSMKENECSRFQLSFQELQKDLDDKCDCIKMLENENASLKSQMNDFISIQQELSAMKDALHNEKAAKLGQENDRAKEVMAQKVEIENLSTELSMKENECSRFQLSFQELQKDLDDKCDCIKMLENENASLKSQMNDFTSIQRELSAMKDALHNEKVAKLGQENDHAKEVMAQKAEIENLSTELSMKENECSRFQLSFQELQKDLDDKCDCIKMLENENASLKSQMNDFTSIQQELSAMKDALHNEKAAKLGQENDHAKEVMAQKAEIENLSTELSMKENECSRFQLSFQELQKDLDDKCDCIKMLENENASLKSQMNDFISIQQELSAMKDALHNEKAAKLGQENDRAKEVMAQKVEIENLSTELSMKENECSRFQLSFQELQKDLDDKCDCIKMLENENASLKSQMNDFTSIQRELSAMKDALHNEKVAKLGQENDHAKEVMAQKAEIENLSTELSMKENECSRFQLSFQELQKDLDDKCDCIKMLENENASLKSQMNDFTSIQQELSAMKDALHNEKAAKLGQENDHAKEVMAQKAEIENLSTELSMKENECSRFQLSFQELQKDLDDKCDCIKMLENENASLKSQMNDFISIQQELSAMKDALHNEKAAKLGQENDRAKEVMAQKVEIENLSTELSMKENECSRFQLSFQELQKDLDDKCDCIKMLENENASLKSQMNDFTSIQRELSAMKDALHNEKVAKLGQENDHAKEVMAQKAEIENLSTELSMKENECSRFQLSFQELQKDLDEKCDCIKMLENENASLKSQMNDFTSIQQELSAMKDALHNEKAAKLGQENDQAKEVMAQKAEIENLSTELSMKENECSRFQLSFQELQKDLDDKCDCIKMLENENASLKSQMNDFTSIQQELSAMKDALHNEKAAKLGQENDHAKEVMAQKAEIENLSTELSMKENECSRFQLSFQELQKDLDDKCDCIKMLENENASLKSQMNDFTSIQQELSAMKDALHNEKVAKLGQENDHAKEVMAQKAEIENLSTELSMKENECSRFQLSFQELQKDLDEKCDCIKMLENENASLKSQMNDFTSIQQELSAMKDALHNEKAAKLGQENDQAKEVMAQKAEIENLSTELSMKENECSRFQLSFQELQKDLDDKCDCIKMLENENASLKSQMNDFTSIQQELSAMKDALHNEKVAKLGQENDHAKEVMAQKAEIENLSTELSMKENECSRFQLSFQELQKDLDDKCDCIKMLENENASLKSQMNDFTSIQQELSAMKDALHNEKAAKLGQENDHAKEVMAQKAEIENLSTELSMKENECSRFQLSFQELQKDLDDKCDCIKMLENENASLKSQMNDFTSIQQELSAMKDALHNEKVAKLGQENDHAKEVMAQKAEIENLSTELSMKENECSRFQLSFQELQKDLDEKCDCIKMLENENASLKSQMNDFTSIQQELSAMKDALHNEKVAKLGQENDHAKEVMAQKAEIENLSTELSMKENECSRFQLSFQELQKDLDDKCDCITLLENENASLRSQIMLRANECFSLNVSLQGLQNELNEKCGELLAAFNDLDAERSKFEECVISHHMNIETIKLEHDQAFDKLSDNIEAIIFNNESELDDLKRYNCQIFNDNLKLEKECLVLKENIQHLYHKISELTLNNDSESLTTNKQLEEHIMTFQEARLHKELLKFELVDMVNENINVSPREDSDKTLVASETIQRMSDFMNQVEIINALEKEILVLRKQLKESLQNTLMIEEELKCFQIERNCICQKLEISHPDKTSILDKLDSWKNVIEKFCSEKEYYQKHISSLINQFNDLKFTSSELKKQYDNKCCEIDHLKSSYEQQLVLVSSSNVEELFVLKEILTSKNLELDQLKSCLFYVENTLELLEGYSDKLERELETKSIKIVENQQIIDKLEASLHRLCLKRGEVSSKGDELLLLNREIDQLGIETPEKGTEMLGMGLKDILMETFSYEQENPQTLPFINLTERVSGNNCEVPEVLLDFQEGNSAPKILNMNILGGKCEFLSVKSNIYCNDALLIDNGFDNNKPVVDAELLKSENIYLRRQLIEIEEMLKSTRNELHLTLNEAGSSETHSSLSEEFSRAMESDKDSLHSLEMKTSQVVEVLFDSNKQCMTLGNDKKAGLCTADDQLSSNSIVEPSINNKVEFVCKKKLVCFVFDDQANNLNEKGNTILSKTAKLENAKLLKIKKLREKEIDKLKIRSEELEKLCHKLEQDRTLLNEEVLHITNEKCELMGHCHKLNEKLKNVKSEAVEELVTHHEMVTTAHEDVTNFSGVGIQSSNVSSGIHTENGISLDVDSNKQDGSCRREVGLQIARPMEQSHEADLLNELKVTTQPISKAASMHFQEFVPETELGVGANVDVKELIGDKKSLVRDVQVDTSDLCINGNKTFMDVEEELEQLLKTCDKLKEEKRILDEEKLFMEKNYQEIILKQSKLNSKNENLRQQLTLVTDEHGNKQVLQEGEIKMLRFDLEQIHSGISICDEEVATESSSLGENAEIPEQNEMKLTWLRKVLNSVLNVPLDFDDGQIVEYLNKIKSDLEEHDKGKAKRESEEKYLGNFADESEDRDIDQREIEMSVQVLRSLNLSSGVAETISHIELHLKEFCTKYNNLMTHNKHLEEVNLECEKLRSEYEQLKMESEQRFNAFRLSCFDHINRNEGWSSITSEAGLGTGLFVSPGLKSPSSLSGSETFLLSDDGRMSHSEIEELQSKVHQLEKENNELRMGSSRDGSGSCDGQLRTSLLNESSAHSHVLITSFNDGDKTKLDQPSLNEGGFQRERRSLSSSLASLNADRFLVISPRSITSLSNDYQIDYEDAKGKTPEDYFCLQNDFKKFKLKVRTEYTKLKNRLVETLKDYNYLKIKYQEVCDANTFRFLCENDHLLIENNALKNRVIELENSISQMVPKMIDSAGDKEEGSEKFSDDVKQLSEKICQQELQISILLSDCNCLSERNTLLENQLLEAEKDSSFERNNVIPILDARSQNMKGSSDISTQTDGIDNKTETALTIIVPKDKKVVEKFISCQGEKEIIENESLKMEMKRFQKCSKLGKPISKLPIRKVEGQKHYKSKIGKPNVIHKLLNAPEPHVSEKPYFSKENSDLSKEIHGNSSTVDQKFGKVCDRCLDLEKQCLELRAVVVNYSEELDMLKASSCYDSGVLQLKKFNEWKTANVLRSSFNTSFIKTSSKRYSLDGIAEFSKSKAKLNKPGLKKISSRREEDIKGFREERPCITSSMLLKSLELELAEIKAHYEILLDDKVHLCTSFEKERTLFSNELQMLKSQLQKERACRLLLQHRLQSVLGDLRFRMNLKGEGTYLARDISHSDSSLECKQHLDNAGVSYPFPIDFPMVEKPHLLEGSNPSFLLDGNVASSNTNSLIYYELILNEKSELCQKLSENIQIERSLREEVTRLKDLNLCLEQENQLLKLDATSLKTQVTLLQISENELLSKKDGSSSSPKEFPCEMSESFKILPIENSHMINIGMKDNMVYFKMWASSNESDMEEWMNLEDLEIGRLGDSLVNSELGKKNPDYEEYVMLIKCYQNLKKDYEVLHRAYKLANDERESLLDSLETSKQKEDVWMEKIDQLLSDLLICRSETLELIKAKTDLHNKVKVLEDNHKILLIQIETIQKSCHDISNSNFNNLCHLNQATQTFLDDLECVCYEQNVKPLIIENTNLKMHKEQLQFDEMNSEKTKEFHKLEIRNLEVQNVQFFHECEELKGFTNSQAVSLCENCEELPALHNENSHTYKNCSLEENCITLQEECHAMAAKYNNLCDCKGFSESQRIKNSEEVQLLKNSVSRLSLENESLKSFIKALRLQLADMAVELKGSELSLKNKCLLVAELVKQNNNLVKSERKFDLLKSCLCFLREELNSIKSILITYKDDCSLLVIEIKAYLKKCHSFYEAKMMEMTELIECNLNLESDLKGFELEKSSSNLKCFEHQDRIAKIPHLMKIKENELSPSLKENIEMRSEVVDTKKTFTSVEEVSAKVINYSEKCNSDLEQKLLIVIQKLNDANTFVCDLRKENDELKIKLEMKTFDNACKDNSLENESIKYLKEECSHLIQNNDKLFVENVKLSEKIKLLHNELEVAGRDQESFASTKKVELELLSLRIVDLENQLKLALVERDSSSKLLGDCQRKTSSLELEVANLNNAINDKDISLKRTESQLNISNLDYVKLKDLLLTLESKLVSLEDQKHQLDFLLKSNEDSWILERADLLKELLSKETQNRKLQDDLKNKYQEWEFMTNNKIKVLEHEKVIILDLLKFLINENGILDDFEEADFLPKVDNVLRKLSEKSKCLAISLEQATQDITDSKEEIFKLKSVIDLVKHEKESLENEVNMLKKDLHLSTNSVQEQNILLKQQNDMIISYLKDIDILTCHMQLLKEKNNELENELDRIQRIFKESLNNSQLELGRCEEEKRVALLEIDKMKIEMSTFCDCIKDLFKKSKFGCQDFFNVEDDNDLTDLRTKLENSYVLALNENVRLQNKIICLEDVMDSLKSSLKEKTSENESALCKMQMAEEIVCAEKLKSSNIEESFSDFASSLVEVFTSAIQAEEEFFLAESDLKTNMEQFITNAACSGAENHFRIITSIISELISKLLEHKDIVKKLIEVQNECASLNQKANKFKSEVELLVGELDYNESQNVNLSEAKIDLEKELKSLKIELSEMCIEMEVLKNTLEKCKASHEGEMADFQSIIETISHAKEDLEKKILHERVEFIEKLEKERFDYFVKSDLKEEKFSQLTFRLTSMEKTIIHLKDTSRMHQEEKELLQLRIMHLTRECQIQEKRVKDLEEQMLVQRIYIMESVNEHKETVKLLLDLKMSQELNREEQKGDIVRLEEELVRLGSNISHGISLEATKACVSGYDLKSSDIITNNSLEAINIRNEQLLCEASNLKATVAELRMENSRLIQENKLLNGAVERQNEPIQRSLSRLSLQRNSPDLRNFGAWKSRDNLAKAESESFASLISVDQLFSFDIPTELINLQKKLVASEKTIFQLHEENNFLREQLFNKQQEVVDHLGSLIAKNKKKKGLLKMTSSVETNSMALSQLTSHQLKVLQEEKEDLIRQVKDLKSRCLDNEQHLSRAETLSELLKKEKDSYRILSMEKEKLEVELLKEQLNVERVLREFQHLKELLCKRERITNELLTTDTMLHKENASSYTSQVLKEEQKCLSIQIGRKLLLRDVAIQMGRSYLECFTKKTVYIQKQAVSTKAKENSVVLDCGCVAELNSMKMKTGCRYHHLVEKLRRELRLQETARQID